jgi:hypothetical protein
MIDLDKLEQAYKDGLAIREKLTDSTPKFIKGVLDKIVNHYRGIPKMRKGDEYYDQGTLELDYGSEKPKDFILGSEKTKDFILTEATWTWGSYDYWTVKIDTIGISITFKPEHGHQEELIYISWSMYNELTSLFD